MLADFQADGRLPMVNGRVKGQRERGNARTAENCFRTRELMPSNPVAKAESRLLETFTTSQVEKTQNPGVVLFLHMTAWLPGSYHFL